MGLSDSMANTQAANSKARQPLLELQFCRPKPGDAVAISRLLRSCPSLDRNSHYAQLLLCWHFAETCVLATDEAGRAAGFVSAYRLPERPEVLFVWQIAVAEFVRGRGVAKRLLDELLTREAVRGVTCLEATVTPSNTASRRLFASWARERGVSCTVTAGLGVELFSKDEPHEPEELIHIGPLRDDA